MSGKAAEFLRSFPVSNFEVPQHIVCVQVEDKVEHAIKKLTDHDIMCAPILTKGSYLGLIDMSKLVADFMHHLHPPAHEDMRTSLLDDLVSLKQFEGKTIDDVADTVQWAEFEPVDAKASLLDACKLLAEKHLHRVPVLDDQGNMVNMITQSAVVRILAENLDKLGDVVHRPLADIGLAERQDVIFAKATDNTIDVFETIYKHKIHAVPIVDEDGAVIGNLSVRDLRDLTTTPKLYRALRSPVTMFIAGRVPDKSRPEMYPAISCRPSSTLAQVIKKLAASRIHRIYVVNDDHTPIRVLSLGDILKFLIEND